MSPSTLQLLARASSRAMTLTTARTYHATAAVREPYKNSQDRNSLNPRTAEHTISGRDEDAAANPDAAFNPSKTSPEAAKRSASDNSSTGSNPLNASGANQELSKPRGDEKTTSKSGAGQETSKGGKSRGASAPKGKDPRNL